mmetsp:Transcript_6177/g.14520  ORF Transcript_6177/g.14520 Transcript_6177/m.14520 type:complete len:202 (-) Transcript_6177:392-997(-)
MQMNKVSPIFNAPEVMISLRLTSCGGDSKGLANGSRTTDSIELNSLDTSNGKATICDEGSADLLALVVHYFIVGILQFGQQAEIKLLEIPISQVEVGEEVNGDTGGSTSGSCGGNRKGNVVYTIGSSCAVSKAGDGVVKVSSSRFDIGKDAQDIIVIRDAACGWLDIVVLKGKERWRRLNVQVWKAMVWLETRNTDSIFKP